MADVFRRLALSGFFALLTLLLLWFTWLSPPETAPVSLVLLTLVAPLLLPMRGLLRGRRYTFAWSGFLALAYFALGVDTAYNDQQERVYGALQVVFSLAWFVGCTMYLRLTRPARSASRESDGQTPR